MHNAPATSDVAAGSFVPWDGGVGRTVKTFEKQLLSIAGLRVLRFQKSNSVSLPDAPSALTACSLSHVYFLYIRNLLCAELCVSASLVWPS